jgi:hypothetical protein
MRSEMCTVASEQLKLITADLSKSLSCQESAGIDICSSYTFASYNIDPTDDTPRSRLSASWSTHTGYHSFELRDEEDLRGRKLRIAVIQVKFQIFLIIVFCYTVTRLHGYTVTRLHGYTVTRLHGYTVTRLHGYTVTLLPFALKST